MASSGIRYFNQATTFKLPHPRITSAWLKRVIAAEGGKLGELNYIFCSDEFLLGINKQFLNHDTYTDIITFPLDDAEAISGEIYISIPRVRENARAAGVVFKDELDRVIVHGVLHLLGYSDKTARLKTQMRKKEDACLSLR